MPIEPLATLLTMGIAFGSANPTRLLGCGEGAEVLLGVERSP